MGISKATVRLWRRGERIPEMQDLLRLPKATNRPLNPTLRSRYAQIVEDAEISEPLVAPGKDLEEASG
jgi:transcriptional regulator with XRE-family HTH domain